MSLSISKKNTGFALAEMLVYMAIMTVITLAIVNVVVVVLKSNKESFTYNNLRNSAVLAMEKMTKEIRSSVSWDVSQSSNNILYLNSIDDSGNARVVEFYVQSQVLMGFSSTTSGVYSGPLTLNGTKVDNLTFKYLDNTNSKAIKIELAMEAGQGNAIKTETFYSTIVLRGSY
jgi:Tfp pilus assembly protein PilV